MSGSFNVQSLDGDVFAWPLGPVPFAQTPYVGVVAAVNNLGGGNYSIDSNEFNGSYYDTAGPDPANNVLSVEITAFNDAQNVIEFTYGYGPGGPTVAPFGGVVIAENANMILVEQLSGFVPLTNGQYAGVLDPTHYQIFSNIDLSQYETYNDGTTGALGPDLPLTFGPTADYTYDIQPAYSQEAPPCFVEGTRVLTARGEVAVEDLQVGDVVVLASGDRLAVIWLGRRRVDCLRHPLPKSALPIRIAPGAFGDGQPHSPLLLSPEHCIFSDGVLIPAGCLVNGTSIVQLQVDEVVYYHVELERHAVLISEGLATESYLDTGNRALFDEDSPVVMLHPDFNLLAWDGSGCAPLVVAGPVFNALRRKLARRAELLAWSEAAGQIQAVGAGKQKSAA